MVKLEVTIKPCYTAKDHVVEALNKTDNTNVVQILRDQWDTC